MKLKKVEFKQILKLHLLKYRTYEQPIKNHNFNFVTDLTLNQGIINFKKILQVIFQYHTMNKRILFIGVPKKLELNINKATTHAAVTGDFNVQGMISNTSTINNKQRLFSVRSLLPKLSKKPDLVVLVSHNKKHNILKECYVAKIPVINFETDNNSKDIWSIYSYKVQLNNKNLSYNKNLFFIGLSFLFKTSKINNNHLKPKPVAFNVHRFNKEKSFQK